MSQLPTNRVSGDTGHTADHSELARLHNKYDGTQPADFAAVVNNLSDVNAAAARTNLNAARKMWLNVRDYGATGDGSTDDSSAIQAAIAAAVNATFSGIGTTVYFPTGKYYVATGLTCTLAGVTFLGEAQTGTSDNLSSGCTQILVGNSQWGLTLGVDGTGENRGYRVEDLHFIEKNVGGATGGLRILSSSDGSYTRVACGGFTAGTGILVDGHDGATQAQYNTFTDCRVGDCLTGMDVKYANGTRLIGGYFEGHHNVTGVRTNSIGLKLESGDTFRSFGTVFQGYDTLVQVAANYNPEFYGMRLENWNTAAINITGASVRGKYHGDGDNSINSNAGTGIIVGSSAVDTNVSVTFQNVHQLYSDSGTRSRYPNLVGASRGASTISGSNIIGRVAHVNTAGVIDGYIPLYDSISGIYLANNLGGSDPGTTGLTTVTRTLTVGAAAGELIVVGGGYGNTSTVTVTVTDSKSNTWTTQRHDDLTTGTTPHSFIAYSVLTTPLAIGDTITATFSGTVNYPMIYCYDYGGALASPVDTSGGATGTSSSPSTGNITTSTDYGLIFASCYFNQSATFTAGSGFTALDTATSTSKTINTESKNGPAAGTFAGATGTLSGSVDWAISVVAFKKA